MSRRNLELISQAIEAFNDGDIDALAALTADDVEIVPLRAALEGTLYRGSDVTSGVRTCEDQKAVAAAFAARQESCATTPTPRSSCGAGR